MVAKLKFYVHCPKSNLNVSTKTKFIPAGAYATAYVWLLCQIIRNHNFRSISTVLKLIFRLFLAQCKSSPFISLLTNCESEFPLLNSIDNSIGPLKCTSRKLGHGWKWGKQMVSGKNNNLMDLNPIWLVSGRNNNLMCLNPF